MPGTGRGVRGFREYFWGGVAILLILAVGAFLLAQSRTDRLREQATLALRKPEALARYDQLSARKQSKPVDAKEPDSVEGKAFEAQPAALDEWGSKDKLARWQHLLTRWNRLMADKSEGSWRDVLTIVAAKGMATYELRIGKQPGELSPEEWTRVETCLAREQDLVREILETAEAGGPVCPLDFDYNMNDQRPEPHEPMPQMCGFLVWDAIVKSHAGNIEGAVDSLIGGLWLGAALQDEPLLTSQYRRMGICAEVEWGLRVGFEAGHLPPGELRRIMHELNKSAGGKAMAEAVRGECFVRMRKFASNSKADAIVPMDSFIPRGRFPLPTRLMLSVYTSPLGQPWFNADQASYADTVERIASAAEGPYYRAQPLLETIDREYMSPSFAHPYLGLMLAGIKSPLLTQADFEASLDLTRIGLLIEGYRAQRGMYPEILDEFASDLGGTVPLDTFSGQPYRYAVNSENFLLYSVGENLRDDGGTPDKEKGDIVWRGER